MARYVRIRAERVYWLEDDAQPCDWDKGAGGVQVHEPEDDVIDTGVLDANGDPIGRVTRAPIGFYLAKD